VQYSTSGPPAESIRTTVAMSSTFVMSYGNNVVLDPSQNLINRDKNLLLRDSASIIIFGVQHAGHGSRRLAQ
jgi:hypothetical protein